MNFRKTAGIVGNDKGAVVCGKSRGNADVVRTARVILDCVHGAGGVELEQIRPRPTPEGIRSGAAIQGVVCGRGRNPTLRLWPTIFSGKIDVFPGDRRSRLISSMTSVARA